MTKKKKTEEHDDGLLDPLDAHVEPATQSEHKDDILDEMTQRITKDIDKFLEDHGLCAKVVDIKDLVEEEKKMKEHFRDGMNSNFFKLYRGAEEMVYFEQMIKNKQDKIPEVSKKYCEDFFRPRNVFLPLERDCRRGEEGKCIASRMVPKGKENAKTAANPTKFCCREFLLPEQQETIRRTQKHPFPQRTCLLCNRFWTTFHSAEAEFFQAPVSYVVQDHKVTIGGENGYDLQNCIPVQSSGLEFYGIAWPFYKYNRADYIFQNKGFTLEVPLDYLNQVRKAFDYAPVDVDKCNNVLRSIPHLNSCRCAITDGSAENSVKMFCIYNFPYFTEHLMKPEHLTHREMENF